MAAVVATIASGGNLLVGAQAFSFFDSAVSSIQTGNVGSFIGGALGAIAFAGIGQQLGLGVAGLLGKSSFTFGGGFAIGATEFGVAGFGTGFGSAIGGGANFGQALKVGGSRV